MRVPFVQVQRVIRHLLLTELVGVLPVCPHIAPCQLLKPLYWHPEHT